MEKIYCALLLNRAEDYDLNFLLARLHAWRFLLFVSGFCFALFLVIEIVRQSVVRPEKKSVVQLNLIGLAIEIPPTEVGGSFKSFLPDTYQRS